VAAGLPWGHHRAEGYRTSQEGGATPGTYHGVVPGCRAVVDHGASLYMNFGVLCVTSGDIAPRTSVAPVT
jgi:hypothetical protein